MNKFCARADNAPREFTQHARNPARSVRIGGANTVFVPAYGCPFVHDIDRGRRVWKTALPNGVFSTPSIARDGTVYVGCLDGKLYALNPLTGSIQWTFDADGMMIMGSAGIDGNGIVYVGDTNGILYAISPNGEEIWRFAANSNIRSAPVITSDGTLYLTSFDSTLYAISQPTAVRDWLLFH